MKLKAIKIIDKCEREISEIEDLLYDFIPFAREKLKFKSYHPVILKSDGENAELAIGKTAYYVSSSYGTLIYPSNHWIHFSEDGMRTNFIKGTQNIGGRYMQLNEKVDHSTNAFYSIEVTGENKLKVQRDRV